MVLDSPKSLLTYSRRETLAYLLGLNLAFGAGTAGTTCLAFVLTATGIERLFGLPSIPPSDEQAVVGTLFGFLTLGLGWIWRRMHVATDIYEHLGHIERQLFITLARIARVQDPALVEECCNILNEILNPPKSEDRASCCCSHSRCCCSNPNKGEPLSNEGIVALVREFKYALQNPDARDNSVTQFGSKWLSEWYLTRDHLEVAVKFKDGGGLEDIVNLLKKIHKKQQQIFNGMLSRINEKLREIDTSGFGRTQTPINFLTPESSNQEISSAAEKVSFDDETIAALLAYKKLIAVQQQQLDAYSQNVLTYGRFWKNNGQFLQIVCRYLNNNRYNKNNEDISTCKDAVWTFGQVIVGFIGGGGSFLKSTQIEISVYNPGVLVPVIIIFLAAVYMASLASRYSEKLTNRKHLKRILGNADERIAGLIVAREPNAVMQRENEPRISNKLAALLPDQSENLSSEAAVDEKEAKAPLLRSKSENDLVSGESRHVAISVNPNGADGASAEGKRSRVHKSRGRAKTARTDVFNSQRAQRPVVNTQENFAPFNYGTAL